MNNHNSFLCKSAANSHKAELLVIVAINYLNLHNYPYFNQFFVSFKIKCNQRKDPSVFLLCNRNQREKNSAGNPINPVTKHSRLFPPLRRKSAPTFGFPSRMNDRPWRMPSSHMLTYAVIAVALWIPASIIRRWAGRQDLCMNVSPLKWSLLHMLILQVHQS